MMNDEKVPVKQTLLTYFSRLTLFNDITYARGNNLLVILKLLVALDTGFADVSLKNDRLRK
jgi:hypothetical protein